VTLYDIIKITGPNGEHDGLVFETMGPDLTTLLRMRLEFQIGKPWERRFNKSFARKALLNTIQALHRLHERGIIHCDLHCGNILACIEPIEATRTTEQRLKQSESDARPLKRKDGKKDLWAPSYLLEPRPLSDYFSYGLDPLVKLADLGGGKLFIIWRHRFSLLNFKHLRNKALYRRLKSSLQSCSEPQRLFSAVFSARASTYGPLAA
jgi:non-specific serine/threonine protein kinase